MSLIIRGRNLASILALSSLMSTPLARAMDARVSGDMLFIICSVAFIMSGSLSMAEGSIFDMSGMPPMPPPAPPAAPRMEELSSIISFSWSGFMFFIMSDICFVRFGSAAICSAALRIMSASSLLLMLSFFRSSSLMSLVMFTACCSSSGFSKTLLMSAGPPAPPPPKAAEAMAERWPSIFLRSSSGRAWRLSMALLIMSGFFLICSIWLRIVAASTPGGRGALDIMLWSSSLESLDMTSVACFSMSGFSASCSAALAHLSCSGGTAPGRLLLLLARLPLEVEGVAVTSAGGCCHSARTACVLGAVSSVRPCSLSCSRRRASSAAMALSPGESSAARRTSATASPRQPSSALAWPWRKRALKLLGSIIPALSLAISAASKFPALRWQSAELLCSATRRVEVSPPNWSPRW
mmetsp:Transcript_42292/g.131051  ORF Transcript_42292/g.131051 Transcript_42292/m.131051 type:complete len:410 (+) Transcript_42292:362-1591(+)